MDNNIILPLPTNELLLEKEKKWRITLPEDYKKFILKNNGLLPEKGRFFLKGQEKLIERFLAILNITGDRDEEIFDIGVVRTQLDERIVFDEDYVGVELLPVAALFAGDFLCLDYSEDKENPDICIWYHEESGELEPTVEFVADSFTEFLEMLH